MVAGTDTTFDLHFLQRVSFLILLRGLVLDAAGLEADLGPEDDVLAQRGRVRVRARAAAGFEAHFRPRPPFRHARVLFLFDDGFADPLRAFDFAAVFVDEDGHDRFGAVFVLGDLGRGEVGRDVGGVFVVGPVGAAGRVLYGGHDGWGDVRVGGGRGVEDGRRDQGFVEVVVVEFRVGSGVWRPSGGASTAVSALVAQVLAPDITS
jgi:hypothetical protein